MAQFAQLLKTQEKETKQLKDVLENFGKQAATVDQLDGTLAQQNQELLAMRQEPTNLIETAIGTAPVSGLPIPEQFAFRQNELRVNDLEREERALMNL